MRPIKVKISKKTFKDLRWKKIVIEFKKWNTNFLTPREMVRFS